MRPFEFTPKRCALHAALTCAMALASTGVGAEQVAGEQNKAMAETVVKERAQERWVLLLNGDLEGAYAFTTPSYRAATPYKQYRGTFGGAIRWKKATIEAVTCEETRCTVGVDVAYTHPRLRMESTRRVEERWLLREGEWWHLPS